MYKKIDKISEIFGLVTKHEASYEVRAVATYYPELIKVFIPLSPYYKLHPWAEPTSSEIQREYKKLNLKEDNEERAIRRAKKLINDYILNNTFDLFVTFTFNDDRQNIERCKRKLSNWLKKQQSRKGKFEYIVVPEFHKDEKSIHFHALIKNYPGEVIEAINSKTNKQIIKKGRPYFSLPSYTLGFTNVQKLNNTLEEKRGAVRYLSKYVTKGMIKISGKNRYWVSTGLQLPRTEDNPDEWYLKEEPTSVLEVEYGRILYFENRKEGSEKR